MLTDERGTIVSSLFPHHCPLALPDIVVVIGVVVGITIVVVAGPPRGAIAIADTIAFAALSWHIIGSTMATALLFLGGRAINTKVE
jgi:hypothetical protein